MKSAAVLRAILAALAAVWTAVASAHLQMRADDVKNIRIFAIVDGNAVYEAGCA